MQTYVIQDLTSGAVKIGKSKAPRERLQHLQTATPHELVLLGQFPTNCERELHQRFRGDRLSGEWFRPTRILDYLNGKPGGFAWEKSSQERKLFDLRGLRRKGRPDWKFFVEASLGVGEIIGAVDFNGDEFMEQSNSITDFTGAEYADHSELEEDEGFDILEDCECEWHMADRASDIICGQEPVAVWGDRERQWIVVGLKCDQFALARKRSQLQIAADWLDEIYWRLSVLNLHHRGADVFDLFPMFTEGWWMDARTYPFNLWNGFDDYHRQTT